MTLAERLHAARAQLTASGVRAEEAAVDVDLYARTLLGWDRARLIADQREPVPSELEPRFSAWLERRANGEPSAYIVGIREFWGLEFEVSPAVLIPRPETELLVEEVLLLLHQVVGPRVADIGTGSGNIAVSIARERMDAHVVATDISAEALALAMKNAARHGVGERIEFITASYLGGVEGDFDLIAANPPYVRRGDKPALARDVKHEPDVALFGGDSGLQNIAGVLDTAEAKLRSAGWLVMEFGCGQEDDVRALVAARGSLRLERIREDLQGIPRTAIMQKHG